MLLWLFIVVFRLIPSSKNEIWVKMIEFCSNAIDGQCNFQVALSTLFEYAHEMRKFVFQFRFRVEL